MQKSVGEEIFGHTSHDEASTEEMTLKMACVTVLYLSGQFLHRWPCHTTLISTHPILAMLTISALDYVLAPRTETGHVQNVQIMTTLSLAGLNSQSQRGIQASYWHCC